MSKASEATIKRVAEEVLHGIKWTNDCNGKQQFDFGIVRFDSRYWPDNSVSGSIYIGDSSTRESGIIQGRSKEHAHHLLELWAEKVLQELLFDLQELGWI